MKSKLRLLLPIAVLVLAGVLAIRFYEGRGRNDGGHIRVSGNIEVTDAEVSFKIPGRVAERRVAEGERVEAGQVVATLDPEDLEQEVALREAEYRFARASLDELEAGSRPEEIAQAQATAKRARARVEELESGSRTQEIAAARAEVERNRAELDRARADFERFHPLLEEQVISAREFETYRTALEVAQARHKASLEQFELVREGPRQEAIEQAREALQEARERLALVRKGPREESIEQARARLEQAKASLEMARIRLGYAAITSPIDGIVLSENVEAGEFVSAGTPVVTVGDLVHVWLRAYIQETDLGRVRQGQRVEVTTDTYPGKIYDGHIGFIASEAEFTPKNVQTEKQRVKLVYRIKIDIRNPDLELKPGMPADAVINLSQR